MTTDWKRAYKWDWSSPSPKQDTEEGSSRVFVSLERNLYKFLEEYQLLQSLIGNRVFFEELLEESGDRGKVIYHQLPQVIGGVGISPPVAATLTTLYNQDCRDLPASGQPIMIMVLTLKDNLVEIDWI